MLPKSWTLFLLSLVGERRRAQTNLNGDITVGYPSLRPPVPSIILSLSSWTRPLFSGFRTAPRKTRGVRKLRVGTGDPLSLRNVGQRPTFLSRGRPSSSSETWIFSTDPRNGSRVLRRVSDLGIFFPHTVLVRLGEVFTKSPVSSLSVIFGSGGRSFCIKLT